MDRYSVAAVRDADIEEMIGIEEELARPETSHSTESWMGGVWAKRISLEIPPTPPAMEVEVKMTLPPVALPLAKLATRPKPLHFNLLDEGRPTTSSSRRLSFSTVSARRPLKYGRGKYRGVELVPQPSDENEDPLNWPVWKKELNYVALLTAVAWAGIMKTAYLGINRELSIVFVRSYSATAALTGVPLILSAVTGMASLIVALVWGKRPVYLLSGLLMWIGALWAMNVTGSYAQAMTARIFQGLGWGAFDTLVFASIQDTFFEHELRVRLGIHHVVAVVSTWGFPLIDGAILAESRRFRMGFAGAAYFFQIVALLLLVLGTPETTYDRSFYVINTPASAWSNKMLPLRPRGPISIENVTEYLSEMKPWSYDGPLVDDAYLLQTPRALFTPTTALVTMTTLLPFGLLWGIASSLALVFTPLPFNLNTSSVTLLLTAPFCLATTVVSLTNLLPMSQHRFSTKPYSAVLGTGSLLAFAGLLSLGIYAKTSTQPLTTADGFAARPGLSLPGISMLIGMVALGAYVLDAPSRSLVHRSAQYTSRSLAVRLRTTADMSGAVAVWRSLIAGIFAMAVPAAASVANGLWTTCVGVAVAQVVLAVAIGAIWLRYEEDVRRMDGRVMGCAVNVEVAKKQVSFFDVD